MSAGDLSKDIDELVNPVRNKHCVVGKLLNDLSEDDATSLEVLLNSHVSNAKIADLLSRHGFKIGETAVWKHKRKSCACVRSQ